MPSRCVRRMPPVSYRCAFTVRGARSVAAARSRPVYRGCVGDSHRPHRGPRRSSPVAAAAIRFRDVAPQVEGRQIREHLITVVPLVRETSSITPVSSSVTVATASKSSAAAVSVSAIVVVSPWSAPWTVTPTMAPVSMSTACSALTRCVRPSFIFVMRASGSCGCCQSVLRPFFGRVRSNRARSARGGVSMPGPAPAASETPDTCRPNPAARCSAGPHWPQGRGINPNGVALDQIRSRQHLQDPREDGPMRLHVDSRRVREIECSGGASSRPSPRKPRSARESAVRHAMRSDTFVTSAGNIPGVRLGRPIVVA